MREKERRRVRWEREEGCDEEGECEGMRTKEELKGRMMGRMKKASKRT